jgi:hypothetical protein
MPTALPLVRILMRVSVTVLLVLGILFWTGRALALVQLHMAFGLILVLGLWVLAGMAAGRGAPKAVVALAVAWGLVVLVLGMTQTRLLPGSMHWAVQVAHLLLGLGAMGLGERLAKGIAEKAGAAKT